MYPTVKAGAEWIRKTAASEARLKTDSAGLAGALGRAAALARMLNHPDDAARMEDPARRLSQGHPTGKAVNALPHGACVEAQDRYAVPVAGWGHFASRISVVH